MDSNRHHLVRMDAFRYLSEAQSRREKFDLIVLDPPSFSNSKKMQGVLDVQQDHPTLILQSLALLLPGGELFFPTNLRDFSFGTETVADAHIADITARTIPDDFRNRKIHHCWLIGI